MTRASAGLRPGMIALGTLVGLYGAYLLLSRTEETAQLVSAAMFLAGGVVLHDFVLAPAVLALSAGLRRLLPRYAQLPAAVALVVVGTLVLVVLPAVTGFGKRPDNPTLLPRHYDRSFVVLLLLTVLGVAIAAAVRFHMQRRPHEPEGSTDGPGPRG